MENIIVPIDSMPTCDDAFKAFKTAVGDIIARNDGHPVELNRSTSSLYARVPAHNVDKTKAEVSALRL